MCTEPQAPLSRPTPTSLPAVVHPDFLERTVGHFYVQKAEGKLPMPAKGGTGAAEQQPKGWCARLWPFSALLGPSRPFSAAQRGRKTKGDDAGKGDSQRLRWVPKAKAAFIQTPQVRGQRQGLPGHHALAHGSLQTARHLNPAAGMCRKRWVCACGLQDFWNVDAADPMVHCARFFYGPMLQGRDGIGAAPCCGTGVVFRRDVLVSIGGQAYGSITEVSGAASCSKQAVACSAECVWRGGEILPRRQQHCTIAAPVAITLSQPSQAVLTAWGNPPRPRRTTTRR